ncbi:hypothetical protein DXG03_003331 [Asterophora parasitica]|uniref:Uncharacterized protein n=1 Tax=Asterophora parasitica TaxID=117018 RepID=A0A9P7FWU0_9AGAR|nr:hypothetical protein DXG03_003331 [Asterophora parasitica]
MTAPYKQSAPICILPTHSSTHSHLEMSDAEFPITPLPMLSPKEWLASLESLMLTLLSTSQTTAVALACVLALVDLTLLTASNSAAPAVVQISPSVAQAATAAIPLPMDLSNLPAFLEAYKAWAAANAKVEIKAQLHPTVISHLCPQSIMEPMAQVMTSSMPAISMWASALSSSLTTTSPSPGH